MSLPRPRISRRCREITARGPLSRLGSVPRPSALTATLALCLAAATALAACGGEDVELLPGSTAREINANLDRVERSAAAGDCAAAAAAADEVSAQVEALEGVDAKLKRALAQGAARLREVVAECEEEADLELEAEPEEEAPADEEEEQPADEGKPRRRDGEERGEERGGGEAGPRPSAPQTGKGGQGKGGQGQGKGGTPSPSPTPEAPAEGGGTETPGGISPGAPAGGG